MLSLSASTSRLDGRALFDRCTHFTGGIGENNPSIRAQVLTHLAILNPMIDSKLNEENGKASNGRISAESGLLCQVIPTNEELMIDRETDSLIS